MAPRLMVLDRVARQAGLLQVRGLDPHQVELVAGAQAAVPQRLDDAAVRVLHARVLADERDAHLLGHVFVPDRQGTSIPYEVENKFYTKLDYILYIFMLIV